MTLATVKIKKLLIGLLSATITFTCLDTYQPLAMITEETYPTTTATYRNPTIDATDKDVMPPLFSAAIQECDTSRFKLLLENSDELDTIYERRFQTDSGVVTKRQNIIEAIASFLTCRYVGSELHHNEATLEQINMYNKATPEQIKEHIGCAKILLDHCVKNNIHLHVNPEQFSPKKLGEDNLWEVSLFEIFDEYRLKYPNLFSREYDDAEISASFTEYVTRFQTSNLENKFDSIDKIRPLLRSYAKKYPEQYFTHETIIDYFCGFYRHLDQHPELIANV